MTFNEVLRMPIKAFWFMNANIVRVAAEFDMRELRVAAASQGEGAIKLHEALAEEQGEVVVQKSVDLRTMQIDTQGLFELKHFMRAHGGG